MAGTAPAFGAVEKLVTSLSKAQAEMQTAKTLFQIRLNAEKDRQETASAALKARDESAQQAQAQPPAQAQGPQLGELFPVQSLSSLGKSNAPAPTNIGDVASRLGVQAGANGGAAVQTVLKGGATPGAVGADAAASVTGGLEAPTRITSERTTTGPEEFNEGRYGSVYRPVTRTESTTTDNALTPAQVIQAKLQEQSNAAEAAQAERAYGLDKLRTEGQLKYQSKLADIEERRLVSQIRQAKTDGERDAIAQRGALSLDVLRTVKGVTAESAAGMVDNLLKGNVQAAFAAINQDVKAFNETQAKVLAQANKKFDLDLQNTAADIELKTGRRALQSLDAQGKQSAINLNAARTADILAKTLGDYSTLPGAQRRGTSNDLTPNQISNISSGLFDKEGQFKEAETANLQMVQGAYLKQGKLAIVDTTDTWGADTPKLITLTNNDTAALAEAIGRVTVDPSDEAARGAINSYRTPGGNPLINLNEQGVLGPAFPSGTPNYGAVDDFISSASNRAKERQVLAPNAPVAKGSPAPIAAPTQLQAAREALDATSEALGKVESAFPDVPRNFDLDPLAEKALSPQQRSAREQLLNLRVQQKQQMNAVESIAARLKVNDATSARQQSLIDAQAAALLKRSESQIDQMRVNAGFKKPTQPAPAKAE